MGITESISANPAYSHRVVEKLGKAFSQQRDFTVTASYAL